MQSWRQFAGWQGDVAKKISAVLDSRLREIDRGYKTKGRRGDELAMVDYILLELGLIREDYVLERGYFNEKIGEIRVLSLTSQGMLAIRWPRRP